MAGVNNAEIEFRLPDTLKDRLDACIKKKMGNTPGKLERSDVLRWLVVSYCECVESLGRQPDFIELNWLNERLEEIKKAHAKLGANPAK